MKLKSKLIKKPLPLKTGQWFFIVEHIKGAEFQHFPR